MFNTGLLLFTLGRVIPREQAQHLIQGVSLNKHHQDPKRQYGGLFLVSIEQKFLPSFLYWTLL